MSPKVEAREIEGKFGEAIGRRAILAEIASATVDREEVTRREEVARSKKGGIKGEGKERRGRVCTRGYRRGKAKAVRGES